MKAPPAPPAVKLNECGRVRCEPGWHLGPAWAAGLRDFDLWFVWAGRGRMRLRDREVALTPGACCWMRPGGRYKAEQDATARLGVNFIHFAPLAAPGFAPPFEFFTTRQLPFVDAVMQRIIALRAAPDSAAAESAAALLSALLRELVREERAGAAGTPGAAGRHAETILRLAARIQESPGAAPSVAALAREAGCSPDHFARIFRRHTGLAPRDYVVQAKIERAKQLLAESALPVGGIATALGFENIYFFSRQFKRKTGRTPTAWRRGPSARE